MTNSLFYPLLLSISILYFQSSKAQSGDLLIQQYGKADIENVGLRKWNYDLHIAPNFFNTNNRTTKGKLGISLGGTVRYNFKKSYGLRTGIDIHSLKYAYNSEKDQSEDELIFLSIPLTGRLYPVNRVKIELGFIYNFILSAKGDPPTNTKKVAVSYPDGTFSNSFGMLSAVHYSVWKRFSVSLQYQFQKSETNPLQRETNYFNGILLGIHYTFLSSKKPSN
tara:strand:- start:27107 stop:27772 length:666 start_codon:yes stop_codon:yes gene_type:complete